MRTLGLGTACGGHSTPRASALPVELAPLLRVVADLVQGLRVVETAVHHHHRDRFRVADVLERVPVEDDQIGKLPSDEILKKITDQARQSAYPSRPSLAPVNDEFNRLEPA